MNYKCKYCGEIFESVRAATMHNTRKHKPKKLSCIETTKEITPKVWRKYKTKKAKKSKTQQLPKMQMLEIPIVIRIPIIFGEIQIVENTDEKA